MAPAGKGRAGGQRLYTIRGASQAQLEAILTLQAANLPSRLSAAERAREGFVTVEHDLALLREMNEPYPHVIAEHAGQVVAYALTMLPHLRGRVPVLAPMFERLDGLAFRGRWLRELRWYVMGQLCVARGHRGRGLVPRLYEGHRTRMAGRFDVLVTEIDSTNPRSLRAHEKAGLEAIDEYAAADGRRWIIVATAIPARDGAS